MARDATGRGKAKKTVKKGVAEPPREGFAKPVVDAARAHPIATAAALAAGGVAVARLVRASRGAAADTRKKAPPPAKKAAARKRAGGAGGTRRGAAGGLARRVRADAALAEVVGSEPITRAEITKRVWDYVKKNGLQDSANRRMINADGKLRPIFQADQVSMFEMTRLVNQHVEDAG